MMTRRSLLAGGTASALAVRLGMVPGGAPRNGRAAAGTPAVGSPMPGAAGGEAGSLRRMLGLAPDLPPGTAPPTPLASYGNVAAQLAAVGAVPPTSVDDPAIARFVRATRGVYLPERASSMSFRPEWRQTFGFDALQIDQALDEGEPPSVITLLRGRFDPNEVRTALGKNGYKPVVVNGTTVLSLHPDPTIDMRSIVSQLALGSMNNLTFLPDGTMVYAGSLAGIRAVLDVVGGGKPGLGRRVDVSTVLAHAPATLASALVASGSALGGGDPAALLIGNGAAAPGAVATEIATEVAELKRMPPVGLALIGWTVGGPVPSSLNGNGTPEPMRPGEPVARCVVVLLMLDQGAAAAAVPVIADRLARMQSLATRQRYAEYFPDRTVRAVPGTPVVVVDLGVGGGRSPGIIFDMFYRRDLLFVAW